MTIRVGICGAGANARGHAAALTRVEGAEVTAVHDVDPARAGELANSRGARVCSSFDELLDSCDAVFVCTWTSAHREMVVPAAAAGRAVFCEKPLATSLADAQEMADAVATAGVVNQVGLTLRWVPEFALLHRLLADRANGQILTASLQSEMPHRTRGLEGWRGDPVRAGGGMLLEVGFHDIDVLDWLVAPVETVSAFTRDGACPDVEDRAALALEFAGGAVGSLVAVWHDAPHRPQTRRLQIVCERAHYQLDIDGSSRRLTVSGPGERQQVLDPADLTRTAADFGLDLDAHRSFVHAVEHRLSATPSFDDALRIHVLTDAAYRSASQHGSAVAATR